MLGYRRLAMAGGHYHPGLKRLKDRVFSEPNEKRKDGKEAIGQVIKSWRTPPSQIYKFE